MKISFDLDDLLIPGMKKFEVEKRNLLQKILGVENLRMGTISLFTELKARGHEIYIYTTSLRSPFIIWLTFFLHGLTLNGIINKPRHDVKIKDLGLSCSKYPPMFQIDIHVDDSEGVKSESQKHGFKTIIVSGDDENWVETVLTGICNYL